MGAGREPPGPVFLLVLSRECRNEPRGPLRKPLSWMVFVGVIPSLPIAAASLWSGFKRHETHIVFCVAYVAWSETQMLLFDLRAACKNDRKTAAERAVDAPGLE